MAWDAEFSSTFEVPGFITYLVRHKVLTDLSWHNDSAPSFGLVDDSKESIVRLWVDHPFRSRRESDDDRFAVATEIKGSQDDAGFSTDDLDEALEKLFQELARLKKGIPRGVLEWLPSGSEDEWDDPVDYLDQLQKAYFEDPR